MPAKKARQQYDQLQPQQQQQQQRQQQQQSADGGLPLEQLPQHVLQQVADLCAEPNAPAALAWAPVCSSWRTAAATTLGHPLSFACGKHLSPALHVRRRRALQRAIAAKHHLPITPVLWASHRDITRTTSLGDWLRYNAASVPELTVQAVTAGHSGLALPVRVYKQLRLDWADAHANLFEALASGGAAAAAAAAEGAAGGDAPKGAPYLTHLQLPGLGHVPAPTLAAGLAACPALQSLSLPYTWPQWLGPRTSSHFGPLYGALQGLTRLVRLELGVDGLQASQADSAAAPAAAACASSGATASAEGAAAQPAAAAAPSEVAGDGPDPEDQVPNLIKYVRSMDPAPGQVDLTPLFQGLPSSIQEVVLTGGSLCKCSLHPRSLQHLHNLRQLQLPEYVVFEGTDEDGCADLAALTALTELRGNDVLSDGSEPLLRVPNLRRLVAPKAALAQPGPLAALAQQQALREVEVVWCDGQALDRYSTELEGLHAAEAAWPQLMATLAQLQQLTSLSLTFNDGAISEEPDAEEPAAAVKQLVNLQALTMPVECLLGATGPAALPKGLAALTLTLGSGVFQEALPIEDSDPPVLLPALSVVSRAHVPALRSVDFRPWTGASQPPSQQQYDELQQGSQALPPRVQVLWGGTPLAQVVPLPAPAVPEAAAAAAAEGGGADEAAAGGGAEGAAAAAAAAEGAGAAEQQVAAAGGGGEGAGAAEGVVAAAAGGGGGGGGDGDVQMAEAGADGAAGP